MMQKQVDRSHYNFKTYMHKARWASVWHQLDETIKLQPKRVLEVGTGNGIFKTVATLFNLHVETLDIDPDLNPDYIASVFNMPFKNDDFDVVCAFQMLEHLPFEQSLQAFKEMSRVAKNGIIISLPNTKISYPFLITLPRIGNINFSIPKPYFILKQHVFDGEHYWEIGKLGYSLKTVINSFQEQTDLKLVRSFRVFDYKYHHFFIFRTS